MNSARESNSKICFWGTSEEYATNEETYRTEEHERFPNDVTYHPVDEQCRKSHEPFPRKDVLYHQDYHEAEKY